MEIIKQQRSEEAFQRLQEQHVEPRRNSAERTAIHIREKPPWRVHAICTNAYLWSPIREIKTHAHVHTPSTSVGREAAG